MFGLANPSISSGLQGAVAYAEQEKQRIAYEKKLAEEKKKKQNYILIGAVALILVIAYYKNK
jgi:hypothetical protein